MRFYLKKENYRVLASIFKISRGDRHIIRWEAFVHSMDALGFKYCKDKGTKRTFKPRRLELQHNFKWHQGNLRPDLQDHMAVKLNEKFGWTGESFKKTE
ncbi:hypothetical protein VTO73DRAFT_2839 [Trametes versicolor]